MRKLLLAAGIAVAALIPSFAMAQQSCEPRRDTSLAGVASAAIGALLGSPAARTDCAHVYGYYDVNGMWHANTADRTTARGYYGRDGAWVAGAPNGYYDSQGRWIASGASVSASGYYDAQGRWVPASASGYYNASGQYVAGAASGYYDTNGRWVAGPATGRYDHNGRWISGQPNGHRDANGVWVADAQPGYYDANGRWRAGPVHGYYDTQGRWIAMAPAAGSYGADVAYERRSMWGGAPADILGRTAWLEQRVRTGMADRTLDRAEGMRALRSLAAIRKQERGLRHRRGQLTPQGQVTMQAKLDQVSNSLSWSRADRRRY